MGNNAVFTTVPSGRSSKHSNVISNWNGFRNEDGLLSTQTSQMFTRAIFVRV